MKEFEIVCPVGHEPTLKEIQRKAAGLQWVLKKRSIDARKEPVMRYMYEAYAPEDNYQPYQLPEYKDVHEAPAVIVVGAGPAGMFAALKLLTLGLKPIVLERGKDVHERKFDMATLSKTGAVNPDSNYCFGEGGAGAFSDGKLFTRSSKRGDIREVLYQLVKFGAKEEILIDSHPHIGTDKLPQICENIRLCVIEHGGEYHFNARVTDFEETGAGVKALTADGTAYEGRAAILATGHSARDIYELFNGKGWPLEAKGFALGVRVEHPQSMINRMRYRGQWKPGMPAAEYSFVEQVDGRGVFSFCMCPGGILVPSSTEEQTVVLNGMSNSARNSKWANAGVVVQIEPEDAPKEYAADGPFSLLNFQRDVERRMYNWRADKKGGVEGNPLAAPAQRMTDFCKGRVSEDLPQTSYHPGAISAPLHELLPECVSSRLRKAFPLVDLKMHSYYTSNALLLGVESRTSSPVRIPRDPENLAYGPEGLRARIFPCGEGAGYSGGIVSSAIDGIRCAVAVSELQ